jgi:hypothetical protein
MYKKEGTRVPFLNSGVWRLLDENKERVGRKCLKLELMRQVDLEAAKHFLSTLSSPFFRVKFLLLWALHL